MNNTTSLPTERLLLEPLNEEDSLFILELVNTEGWTTFIGNRNIHSDQEALKYIRKITENPDIRYWTAKLKENSHPIGVITYIKRTYLSHPDIGFAFLPAFSGRGYAYEGAQAILNKLTLGKGDMPVLATTLPDNVKSIQLLHRLGMEFEREIEVEKEMLQLYSLSSAQWQLNSITTAFFSVFDNTQQRQPNWESLHRLCIPEIRMIRKAGVDQDIDDLPAFIAPRQKSLADNTLTEFKEYEVKQQTIILGHIAQRHSVYEQKGFLNGKPFLQTGHKLFQFLYTAGGWRISSLLWEEEP